MSPEVLQCVLGKYLDSEYDVDQNNGFHSLLNYAIRAISAEKPFTIPIDASDRFETNSPFKKDAPYFSVTSIALEEFVRKTLNPIPMRCIEEIFNDHFYLQCNKVGQLTGEWTIKMDLITAIEQSSYLVSQTKRGLSLEVFLSQNACQKLRDAGYDIDVSTEINPVIQKYRCICRAENIAKMQDILKEMYASEVGTGNTHLGVQDYVQEFGYLGYVSPKLVPVEYPHLKAGEEVSDEEKGHFEEDLDENKENHSTYTGLKRIELWYNKSEVAFIIGEKGARIRFIREKTGATIKILPEDKSTNERLFTLNTRKAIQRIIIIGTYIQVNNAKFLIENVLVQRAEGILKK